MFIVWVLLYNMFLIKAKLQVARTWIQSNIITKPPLDDQIHTWDRFLPTFLQLCGCNSVLFNFVATFMPQRIVGNTIPEYKTGRRKKGSCQRRRRKYSWWFVKRRGGPRGRGAHTQAPTATGVSPFKPNSLFLPPPPPQSIKICQVSESK